MEYAHKSVKVQRKPNCLHIEISVSPSCLSASMVRQSKCDIRCREGENGHSEGNNKAIVQKRKKNGVTQKH